MAADQQFCLRWNNHQSTLISVFDTLLASGQLVDCTIAAEGQFLKAHKVVLSACSPYLELLLSQHYEKHPIVILKDVKFQELKSMMDYMYKGEVNISQDQLATFLKAAESLQIKGLTDSGEDSRDVGSTKRIDGPAQNARKPVAVPASQPPRSPAVLNPSSSGLTIEPRQPSPHRSRDGSMSPTPRKRPRRQRRQSGDDNQLSDSHIESSNNSCDLPSQSVSSVPAPTTSAVTISKSLEAEQIETEHVNRLGSSINSNVSMDAVLIKEKVEPNSELMIEPKTEYLDENNEDSVEDLTLDDDDDLDVNRSGMDLGRAGPSHGDSNQGFAASWHMQGDRSGTDEVFMAAQEAVGAHRDSQDDTDEFGDFQPATTKKQVRIRRINGWTRQRAEKARAEGLAYFDTRGAFHPEKNVRKLFNHICRFNCNNFSEGKRQEIFHSYWNLGDVALQISFLSSCIRIIEPRNRRRSAVYERRVSCTYTFDNARVCKEFFLATLDISQRRVTTVIKHKLALANSVPVQDKPDGITNRRLTKDIQH